MSLVLNIVRTYRRPRAVVKGLISQELREPQVFFFNALFCVLVLFVQLPVLSLRADTSSMSYEELRSGTIMGVLFVLPLLLYGLALVLGGVLRVLRNPAPGLWVRLALFWSLLAVTPLMMVHSALSATLGQTEAVIGFGFVVAGAFLYILISALVEVTQLAHRAQN